MLLQLALLPLKFIAVLAFFYLLAGWLVLPPSMLVGAF